ncbi:Protein kinase domain protein [Piscirickettsiaceae bacterium NZ-RLO1]|uniref:protein kinase domain-containing protein n=1 Tax=Piscirickettsia salmonis TaxID=1238 RepID=UPI0007D7BEA0|nr:Protein kinase domain protein [Piscirickettsiaceae bacterium NZ-RLO1]
MPMPILEYKRPRSGSIIERKLENGSIETYQSVGSLGEGRHGSVRRFESQTGLAKFAVKRPLRIDVDDLESLWREKCFFESAYPNEEVLFTRTEGYDGRLVMTLFPGNNFHETLQKYPENAHEIVVAVALELQRIHNLGLQHGDIKFDNVIIEKKSGVFNAKFIDFGFAYLTPGEAITTSEVCPYFAPERTQLTDYQVSKYQVTKIVEAEYGQDVYSFGYMLAYAHRHAVKMPQAFYGFISNSQNKVAALRPTLISFLQEHLQVQLGGRYAAIALDNLEVYQSTRSLGLDLYGTELALDNLQQFDLHCQRLGHLGLKERACIHKVLNNPWEFYGSYACLSSIYDEIQQVHEGIKAHITAENWQPIVGVQFNLYQSQALQAVFEFLMSEKPDLKMLISQLAKYEAEFLSSSNIKNNCSEFAMICPRILEKIRAQTTSDEQEERASAQHLFFNQQEAGAGAAATAYMPR